MTALMMAACRVGILTDEEFAAKKSERSGGFERSASNGARHVMVAPLHYRIFVPTALV